MGRLRRLLEITARERWLLLRAFVLLVAIRLSLWILPFTTVRRLVSRVGRRRPGGVAARFSPQQLAWAVRVASRYVPSAHCLTQALGAQALLTRSGYPARLRFGVANDRRDGFVAHAWVECEGSVVIGDTGLDRYVELSSPPTPV